MYCVLLLYKRFDGENKTGQFVHTLELCKEGFKLQALNCGLCKLNYAGQPWKQLFSVCAVTLKSLNTCDLRSKVLEHLHYIVSEPVRKVLDVFCILKQIGKQ